MNQNRFSITDLDNQAKEHEAIACALRLVIRNIKMTDSSYQLQIEAANELEANQVQSSTEVANKRPRKMSIESRRNISRGMRNWWKKRKK